MPQRSLINLVQIILYIILLTIDDWRASILVISKIHWKLEPRSRAWPSITDLCTIHFAEKLTAWEDSFH